MTAPLRCISLHQPWASLIAVGVKTIETRSRRTKVRGRIGIVSTKRRPLFADMKHLVGDLAWKEWYAAGLVSADGATDDVPLGALVATAKLVDCVPMIAMNDMSRDGCHRLFVGDDCLWRTRPGGGPAIDITDQRPYGEYAPGRWAWLLDDIKPTSERCPACWGTGDREKIDPLTDEIIDEDLRLPCARCGGDGYCEPIPVKGKQGFWWWQP